MPGSASSVHTGPHGSEGHWQWLGATTPNCVAARGLHRGQGPLQDSLAAPEASSRPCEVQGGALVLQLSGLYSPCSHTPEWSGHRPARPSSALARTRLLSMPLSALLSLWPWMKSLSAMTPKMRPASASTARPCCTATATTGIAHPDAGMHSYTCSRLSLHLLLPQVVRQVLHSRRLQEWPVGTQHRTLLGRRPYHRAPLGGITGPERGPAGQAVGDRVGDEDSLSA